MGDEDRMGELETEVAEMTERLDLDLDSLMERVYVMERAVEQIPDILERLELLRKYCGLILLATKARGT